MQVCVSVWVWEELHHFNYKQPTSTGRDRRRGKVWETRFRFHNMSSKDHKHVLEACCDYLSDSQCLDFFWVCLRDYHIIQVREVVAKKKKRKKESEWGLPPWKCQDFLSRLTPVSLAWRLSGCCDVKLNKTLFLSAKRVFHKLFLFDTSPPASQLLAFLLYVVHEQSWVLSSLFSYCNPSLNASSLARTSLTLLFIVAR